MFAPTRLEPPTSAEISPIGPRSSAGFGVIADGRKTTIRLGGSSIAGNPTGVGVNNGGVLQSYGTNQINANSNDGIASLTPIGLH
ncbi:MAG: hypothetical protein JO273_11795 [Methylobacteriaceae bacterium]|nr:hypothetical protein [Methylobacteriaceae bacterium]